MTEETGNATETGETTETGEESSLSVTNQIVTSDDCDNEGGFPDAILTIATDGGNVQVTHENFVQSSCLGFDVGASLDADVVTVSYSETGEPCDCTSLYALTYQIEGLQSGTYELNVPGEISDSFTID